MIKIPNCILIISCILSELSFSFHTTYAYFSLSIKTIYQHVTAIIGKTRMNVEDVKEGLH